MALLPIPSGLVTSNEFESVQGFNALGAPVVVPKTNYTYTGNVNLLPGSLPGTTATGGQYA